MLFTTQIKYTKTSNDILGMNKTKADQSKLQSFQIKERQMKNTWRNKRGRRGKENQENVTCLDSMLDLLYYTQRSEVGKHCWPFTLCE